MEGENGTGNNLIWAVTMIIIVAIIAGAIYFAVLKGDKKDTKDIDIEIKVPTTNSK